MPELKTDTVQHNAIPDKANEILERQRRDWKKALPEITKFAKISKKQQAILLRKGKLSAEDLEKIKVCRNILWLRKNLPKMARLEAVIFNLNSGNKRILPKIAGNKMGGYALSWHGIFSKWIGEIAQGHFPTVEETYGAIKKFKEDKRLLFDIVHKQLDAARKGKQSRPRPRKTLKRP